MAFLRRQHDVSQAFRDDPQLQQFLLNDATPTGRVLGTGSYGSVVEVNYRKLVCAGKKLHESLLDVGNEGVPEMVRRYLQECQLMSSLRHPNITQFLGICFLPETRLPLLVMECLETSLDDLLEHMPNLPLSLKRSVLEDVASGLLYLHKMQPPVIHRDLTSKNVLLTSSLVAKITDMGNSRIVDLRPGQMARTLSRVPGTAVYMPPEALDDRHHYGPSLDIFSFGHLALYTLTQVFPGTLLPSTYYDPDNMEAIRARTELERRETYIELLEAHIGAVRPAVALVQLVKQCLHNIPEQRPSTEELLTRLQGMRGQVEGEYGGGAIKLDLARVRLAKEVKENNRRIVELTQQQEAELEVRDRRVEALRADIQTKEDHNHQLQDEIAAKDDQNRQLQDEITAKEDQLRGLMGQLEELQADIQLKNDQLEAKEREIRLQTEAMQSKEAEMSRLREALRQLQQAQQQGVQQGPLKLPLQLTWGHGPDMPFEMTDYVQSVVVQGKVYVGGGYASIFDRGHTVMEYDHGSEKWSTLPEYMARKFAMAVLHNQLVLVGGKGRDYVTNKVVGIWEPDNKKWIHSYPEMSTARFNCSAVANNEWLVVAGGQGLSSVEVLNMTTRAWQAGPPLPVPLSSMKTAIVEDTFYLIGGYATGRYTDKMYSASFQTLILHINTRGEAEIWKEIPGLQLKCSTPLSISGSLLAVGGVDTNDNAVAAIHLYQPDTGDWVKVGDLPSPRYNCTCAVNTHREIIVLGEKNNTHSRLATMDIASLN